MPTAPSNVAPSKIVAFLRENWRATQPKAIDSHGALLLLDPSDDTPFASASRNTVNFFDVGDDNHPTAVARASAILEHYVSRLCSHCFVYVQPTPTVQKTMTALAEAGFTRFDVGSYRPRYHTLTLDLTTDTWRSKPVRKCVHLIRRIDPHRDDAPIIERFAAFDGDTCVGRAALHVIDDIALLAAASTDEPFRNQGIQTNLIRMRLERAKERGCRIAVCETLSMLGSSLNNLKRAGFTIAYDKPVFEWRRIRQ